MANNMSTVDKLRLLLNTKREIRSAIESKGVSISNSDSFKTYVNKISQIPQIKYNNLAVRFIDYNGDILHTFNTDEIDNLTSLPELPSHNGLICQGWNWTLEDIKQTVREHGRCDVGAIYITDDGKTRLYIKISNRGRMTIPLYFTQNIANGVIINWGDGSEETTIANTGRVNPKHTYSEIGEYVITLSVVEGCTLQLGHGSENYNILGYYGSVDRAYSGMLTKIELGINITGFAEYCFNVCSSMATINIPESIQTIPNYCFNGCRSLHHLNVPTTVSSINTYAYSYCANLENISLSASVTSIGANAFQYCDTLKSIIIPNVITVNDYLFSGCDSLSEIILSKNLTSIGQYSFEYTYSLDELNIYNVASIGQYAFRASKIKNLILPEGITSLQAYVFDNSGLMNIILPNTLVTINNYAFNKCTALKEIIIPNSVTTINDHAFSDCASLVKVVLPDSITTIPSYSFNNCSSLIDINIPESVKTIQAYAFYGCGKLTDIVIPDTVTSIGANAFRGCSFLPEIVLPVLNRISDNSFNGCSGAGIIDLTKFGQVPGYGADAFKDIASDCKILVPSHLYDSWKTKTGWSGLSSKITSGYTLSNIASYALFADNVQHGNNTYTPGEFSCITYGTHYFGDAETRNFSVKNLDLYVGSNKTTNSVSKEVRFEYAGNEYSTTVTQGPYIENAILCKYNATSTTSATTLLYSSFGNTSYFSKMIIDGVEKNVTKTYTFSSTGEHDVIFKLADGVSFTTPYRMFYGCSALKSIDLSEVDMSSATSTSTSAGTAYMFYNCSGLKSIILPETAKYLGSNMFYGCINVEKFVIKAKVAPTLYGYTTWGQSSYYLGYNTRANLTNQCHVPYGATGYNVSNWTSYLFNTSSCGFTKTSPCLKVECTDLSITAADVTGNNTTTTITWNAVVSCIDQTNDEPLTLTFTGTSKSSPFPKNESYTESIDRETSFTYMGITATTTFVQQAKLDWNFNLNNQWRLSTSVTNPDAELYDGVYESNSNYHVNNGVATMYIDIYDRDSFKLYIRSNGESNYDYVMVSQLDKTITGSTSYSSADVKAHTRGVATSGTAISNYKLVEFTNIGGGEHRITIIYQKDSGGDNGTDRGYILVPKQQ